MGRRMRGLWLAGAFGLLLLLAELFLVRAGQHASLPIAVLPEQAKVTAAKWLGDVRMTVRQEENLDVSRYLHQQGLTDQLRATLATDMPLLVWKVTSGDAEASINRQSGRIEGLRGITIAQGEELRTRRADAVREILEQTFGQKSLVLTSIDEQERGRALLTFHTSFAVDSLTDRVEAEVVDDRLVAFTHRLQAPLPTDRTSSPIAETVQKWAGWFQLAVLILPLIGMWRLMRGDGGARRLYGELALSGAVAIAFWLKGLSADYLLQGVVYGAIVFGVLAIVKESKWPADKKRQSARSLHDQILAGYCIFGVLTGCSVLFSWGADLLGAWSSDLQAQEAVALAPLPFLLPLIAAGTAAVYEELVYRKLGDLWLSRLFKPGAVVALLCSLIWSTAHLQYGVWPWYLRIIELGLIIGPLLFFLYRRYGLVAVITGHFLYNACLISLAVTSAFGNGWSFVWLTAPLLLLCWKRKGPLA